MATDLNFDQAVQRLKDIDAGLVDPNVDSTCWLCGSDKREVRNMTTKSGPFEPNGAFNVTPENSHQSPCSCDWHSVLLNTPKGKMATTDGTVIKYGNGKAA